MKKQLLIILLLFIGTMAVYPQLRTVGSDSERIAEYKKAIGLDTTVPDFDTNKIDAKVMGSRLANLLNYLLENYNQGSYELQITQILGEQNESLQHLYYKIKKMQFANASKQGDVMTVFMHVWPDKNIADVDQADLMFRFVDGVSDDQTTNALFSYMSRYVEAQTPVDSKAIVTNSFWDNWYGQIGIDMSLQNPYGSNFTNVFPNGKSFGFDFAIGKWFRPEFGVRAKVNLENVAFQSEHANASWLRKVDTGYLSVVADFQFDIQNLFGNYQTDRKWSMIVFPRAGALMSFRTTEGSPMLGLGIGNIFRLNNRWSIFADVAYQVLTSVIGPGTDTGSGNNGFFDICIGAQMNLGKQGFHKVSDNVEHAKHAVINNGFWDNWFIQVGLGMSLLNPHGNNFMNVFPNGETLGVNLGIGKWITPEVGIRGGLNWQNGIIGNNHLTWLDTEGKPGSNHDAGGYAAVYADLFFDLQHLFKGYSADRVWNAIVYPRFGLNSNFEGHTGSPMIGFGTEQTFRLNERLTLFSDFTYQVTSSEFMMAKSTVRENSSGSNGWFDINIGVQYELGQIIGWNKPGERPTTAVNESGHNWPRFIVNTGASVIVAFGVKTVFKKAIKEERPDHSDNKSFPSGHASMAFAAARSIDKEFRKDCIWIPIAGYAAATAIGVERVVNKHHHWYDVLAGAGIGFGSAELTWWLSDLMFGKGRNVAVGSSGNTLDVTYSF